MNTEEIDFPSPDELKLEADGMPPKISLSRYHHALEAMRSKGYSYAEVARWISEKLGQAITRNQVAYLLTTPPEALAAQEEEEEMEDRADEFEGNR